MGSARAITAATFIDQINYELRNTNEHQFTEDESLVYINKMYEMIYMLLCDMRSELVRTGSGSVTTVAGTETYSLTTATMGDFWMPWRIQISKYNPMRQVQEDDRWEYKIYEDNSSTALRSRPTMFYIRGDYLGLLPIANAVYTVNVFYFPNFVPLANSGVNMPLNNLFNQQIGEGLKFLAKNREENPNSNIDALLMKMFMDRANKLSRLRKVGAVEYGLAPTIQPQPPK